MQQSILKGIDIFTAFFLHGYYHYKKAHKKFFLDI